jgi:predicted ribosomally synthesized peptide with SipW-like signal peptide
MKKLLYSVASAGMVATVVILGTNAFFSDEEKSVGNVFQAGAIDLKVDNTCYYNGQACIDGFWGGKADPIENPTNKCSCTWSEDDLNKGQLFFNFSDLKPGDWEEDTISLRVYDNDAWACASIELTQDDDNTCTEPELDDDESCNEVDGDLFDGEIAKNLQFMWWLDDGDNVLEAYENILFGGPVTLADMVGPDNKLDLTFADSSFSMLGQDKYMVGGKIYFIGKAFCFGKMTPAPLTEPGDYSPTQDQGFTCDGSVVNNAPQTDVALGNIGFYVEQVRNNPTFLCPENRPL